MPGEHLLADEATLRLMDRARRETLAQLEVVLVSQEAQDVWKLRTLFTRRGPEWIRQQTADFERLLTVEDASW
jgi:hypothetical protein